jgi:hypothetical protein
MDTAAKIPWPFSAKVFLVLFALFAVGAVGVWLSEPPPTPEQVAASKAADAAATKRHQLEAAEQERENFICDLVNACKKYATVRQECAVAGNFKNCVNIKMGRDDWSYCSDDGKLPGWEQPPAPRCWVRSVARSLGGN